MPHIKLVMLDTIESANTALRNFESGVILRAESLAELANSIGLSDVDLDTISHLYPEIQYVILHALKSAATAGRPAYLSWRHSAIQRVEVTAPPASAPTAPLDIRIESRYIDDGLYS